MTDENTTATDNCYACEAPAAWRDGTTTVRAEFGELKFEREVAARVCVACGQAFALPDALAPFEAHVVRELVATAPPSPEALRYLRRATRLRLAEISALISVSPGIWKAWERGKGRKPFPRSIWSLTVLLAEDAVEGRRTTLERLERVARNDPARVPLGMDNTPVEAATEATPTLSA